VKPDQRWNVGLLSGRVHCCIPKIKMSWKSDGIHGALAMEPLTPMKQLGGAADLRACLGLSPTPMLSPSPAKPTGKTVNVPKPGAKLEFGHFQPVLQEYTLTAEL
jgi:hypothetical protein